MSATLAVALIGQAAAANTHQGFSAMAHACRASRLHAPVHRTAATTSALIHMVKSPRGLSPPYMVALSRGSKQEWRFLTPLLASQSIEIDSCRMRSQREQVHELPVRTWLSQQLAVPHSSMCRQRSPQLRAFASQPHRSEALRTVYKHAESLHDNPGQEEVEALASAMLHLNAEELGLSPPPAMPTGGAIGYQGVHSDRRFSMGIFILPAGTSIPLHDHPDMSVLSKLLFGALRVTSFDMPAKEQGKQPRFGFGRRSFGGGCVVLHGTTRACVSDSAQMRAVDASSGTLILDAVQGNVHQFEAIEDTAVFDVLLPPYSDLEGRSCHYYEQVGMGGKGETILEEVDWPPSLSVRSMRYDGPLPA